MKRNMSEFHELQNNKWPKHPNLVKGMNIFQWTKKIMHIPFAIWINWGIFLRVCASTGGNRAV